MKALVFALAPLTQNLKGVVQALKVFRKHKGKFTTLHVFGSPEETNILKDNKDFEIHAVSKENIAEEAETFALSLNAPLILLGERSALVESLAAHLTPIEGKKPVLGLLLPSAVYNHSVFLVDVGANTEQTSGDLESEFEAAKAFEEKILLLKGPRFGLLYPGKPTPTSLSAAFDLVHHSDPRYCGIVSPSDILKGQYDLLVGESLLMTASLESAKGNLKTLLDFESTEVNKSVFFKFGRWWLRDVQKTMQSRFDSSYYANGLYFLNYPIPVIGLEPSVNYGAITNALELSLRF
jgi:fatty acid/phospholipid biosynthesis enzyme